MAKALTYLDYNATAPLRPEVKQVMQELLGVPMNASSVHAAGREAKRLLEQARRRVQDALDADAYQVIFTASGTEANNQALSSLRVPHQLFISAVEHDSVLKKARDLEAITVPVDTNGIVDLRALDRLLLSTTKRPLVSVMVANNETGVIQPLAQIAEIVFKHRGFLHCDAAQAVGKLPHFSIRELNADMVTVSSHKIGGPVGAAALLIKKGLDLGAYLQGGGQEFGYRAGTENIPAILGFAKALELSKAGLSPDLQHSFEQRLLEIAPDAVIFGKEVDRLPNTTNIALPHVSAETQVIALDLEGVAISSGAACSSGKVSDSHVLTAMNVAKELRKNAIRISTGYATSQADLERFITAWKKLASTSQKKLAA